MSRRRDPPRWSRRGRGTRYRKLARQRAAREEQRKRSAPAPEPSGFGDAFYDDDDDDDELEGVSAWGDRYALQGTSAANEKKRGFFDMVFGLFGRKSEPLAARADPPPSEDPVRRILAMPRGAARLDAFEHTLLELPPGSHGHRGVALAFHRELTTMAKHAKLDLSLLKRRVEACAEALLAAGDVERAGLLLSQIGKKRRAAELFVAAGLIDELEEAHAAIDQNLGGAHLDARLAYERFEGLFLVGMRKEALASLEAAIKSWPDNPVYQEIAAGFRRRVQRHEVVLEVESDGGRRRLLLSTRFPLVIGRGEGAALRLLSPLISREHLEIVLDDGRPVLRNLQPRPVSVDGVVLDRPRPLAGEGSLDVSGVCLRYALRGAQLWLWSDQQADVRSCALLESEADVELDERGRKLRFRFDAERYAYVLPAGELRVGDEPVKRPLLLLEGDRLFGAGVRARVLKG